MIPKKFRKLGRGPFTKTILVMKKLKHSERARLSANRTVGETYG